MDGFLLDAAAVGTLVAVLSGVVGLFVVLRGGSFAAHAVPQGAFTGAAGAALAGVAGTDGLVACSLLGAMGIGWLGRRGRHDVATALGLVALLGTGALFLGLTDQYSEQSYSLLFGDVLSVTPGEVALVAVLTAVGLAAVAALWRPLLLSSVAAELGEAQGVRAGVVESAFLLLLALATVAALPVVGALLVFSLMVGPPAAARSVAASPGRAAVASAAIAVVVVWVGLAAAVATDWPVSFWVGVLGALAYGLGRVVRRGRRRR